MNFISVLCPFCDTELEIQINAFTRSVVKQCICGGKFRVNRAEDWKPIPLKNPPAGMDAEL